jgi:superfamily II helicase
MEIWKDVIGFEGRYYISNLGNVRSRFKVLKPHLNRDGYMYINMINHGKNNGGKTAKVHRLVALHFVENLQNKPHIDHIDGNKFNNVYTNLRWCTHQENITYAWESGIYNNVGSKHAMSKLTESQVIEIRNKLNNGQSGRSLANEYNVKGMCISNIKNNITWRHINTESE